MKKLSLHNLDLKGKRVLMRVDFNVPLDSNRHITDDTRITASLPSIEYVLKQGASLILISHLGRPKGTREPKYSLEPCAVRLGELLETKVYFAFDCIGPAVNDLIHALEPGNLLLLENLRFHSAEEHPSEEPGFAKTLAQYAEYYVNDAFGTAHRSHSSNTEITKYFTGKAATGFLMEKEISFLEPLSINPRRPFYAILGGSKVETKLEVLKALLHKIDALFIGGGMAFTFLKAQNFNIGDSLFEENLLETAKMIIKECSEKAVKLHLPKDLVITQEISDTAEHKTISVKEGVPECWKGVDIGPQTVEEWQELIQSSATIFWNGPMGIFEIPSFAKGTKRVAFMLSQLSAMTIVGGGDSVAAIKQSETSNNFSHISTGGGASLEFIKKGHLPAIDALSNH